MRKLLLNLSLLFSIFVSLSTFGASEKNTSTDYEDSILYNSNFGAIIGYDTTTTESNLYIGGIHTI